MSAIVTTAAIGLVFTLASARVGMAACPAAAAVLGAESIAEPVRAILRSHDVATSAGECTQATARVEAWLIAESGARGYVLRIQDAFGRRSERRISDAGTAASLIESWLAPEPVTAGSPGALPAVGRPQATDVTETRAAPPPASAGWRITGAAEVGISGGDSLWYGGAVTACGSVGPLCVGGRLRMIHDDNFFDLDHDSGSRSAVELLALAAWPLAGHGLTLTPLLGFGVGRLHGDNPNLADGEADMPGGDDFGLRTEAAASAGVSLTPHVVLAAELGASHAWSIETRTSREALPGLHMSAPTNFLRAAIALQYTP